MTPIVIAEQEVSHVNLHIGEYFLPKSVQTKLKAQSSQAELRNAAVIFIGLKPKNDDSTIPVDAYHMFYRELQRCVYELDGTINKIDFTDKGYLIILNFGIPLIHFDDIERAFICSYRILQIHNDAIQLRIGITYSNIYAGILGSDLRYEYGIIGDAVNTAVRLMSTVEYGEIAFSEEILPKIVSRFETLFLKTSTVKGIKIPIRIYKLLRELPENWVAFNHQFKEQRLVAYEKEVDTILHGFEQKKLEIAALSGDPGAGKSFLSYRIMDHFNEAGKCIELIVLDEFDQNGQMQLFFKILQRRLFLTNLAKEYSQLESYCKVKGLAIDFHLLQRYLSASKQVHDNPDESLLKETQLLFANMAQLLAETLKGVDLLLIDNMHWIDGSSKAILLKLIPLILADNCCVTVTTRFNENLEFLNNYRHFLLELKNLSQRGVGAMIQANLPNVSQDAIAHLFKITQGNPLFVVEMCKVIKQHFNYKQDLLTEDALLSLERQGLIPQTIENLFVNQFESLDQEAQEVLKIASIIGKAFTLDDYIIINQQILHQEIYAILNHLSSDRIIDQKSFDPKVEYAFSNHLMRDAIYRIILMSEKRSLHGRIAAFYEQKYAADLYPYYELLASHNQLAEEIEKTCEYCRLAAEKNFSLSNFGESIYFYEMALKVTQDIQTQTELRLALVECLLFKGNTNEAVTQFETIDSTTELSDQTRDKWIYLRAKILDIQANYIELKQFVESMTVKITTQPYANWFEFVYLDALQSMNFAEQFEERALHMYEEFVTEQDHHNLVRLGSVIGQYYLNQSRYQDAIQYYETVYRSGLKIKDNIAKRTALSSFGIIHFRKGERQKCMSFYRRALRLAEKTGDRNGYSKVIMDMGTIYRNEAKFNKAIACYEKSLIFTKLTGNRQQEETTLYNIGEAYYYLEKKDIALTYFQQSLEMSQLIGDSTGVSYAYDAIGDVYYQTGNNAKAKEIYLMNLELQQKLKDNEAIAHTYGNLANVAKSEEDYALAESYYLKQVPLLEAQLTQGQPPRLLHVQDQRLLTPQFLNKKLFRFLLKLLRL